MSITEDAQVAPPTARPKDPRRPGPARRVSPWWWLVACSAIVLAMLAAVLGVWWVVSSETRVVTYRALGTLTRMELDLGAADVEIVGGARAVDVRRTDEFAFGRGPDETRALIGSVLRIRVRCPETVIGTCSSAYRIQVPDNVQLVVNTTSGPVSVSGLNGSATVGTTSGPIAVAAFCGFSLSATSSSGDVRASADCSPERMELRSASGDVHALVPAGRYRVEAVSDTGDVRVGGVDVADDASFAVEVVSATGDVTVEGRR